MVSVIRKSSIFSVDELYTAFSDVYCVMGQLSVSLYSESYVIFETFVLASFSSRLLFTFIFLLIRDVH